MNNDNIEELKKVEERYKSIIESSSDVIFVIDKDFKYLYVNKVCARNFGKPADELIGRPMRESFPEIIAEGLAKNIKKVFDTKDSLTLEEKIEVQGKDTYNSSSLNPIMNDAGEVVAVSGIVRDITDKKKAEEELNIANEELEQKLEELEKVNKLMVGRELAMVELKEKMIELEAKLSKK